MSRESILIVDDEPAIRNLVQEILVDEGYAVQVAENTATARQHAHAEPPDLVLLDIWMPGEDGISLLKDWQGNQGIDCPVVMMSGHGTVETAVEATRLGAYGFIEKPLTTAKLLASVRDALEHSQERMQQTRKRFVVEEPVGMSVQMRTLRDQARKLAQHDNVVLITGESGAGKKTFARYVHAVSARQGHEFIVLSEGDFSDRGLARELFGSEADGAVTPGILEQCRGGTVLVDDVASIPVQDQKILSRLIERGQYSRVGGTGQQGLEARIVVATRCNLQTEVQAGRFDATLYFQLNAVPIHVPALREHLTDVPALLHHFTDLYCTRENYPYRKFSIAAQNLLLHYDWPGNVRELGNLVQRLLILGISDEISVGEVEAALDENVPQEGPEATWRQRLYQLPLREARESFERDYLLHQLRRVEGNISKLARRVGLERTHLYRKLRALGITPKEP